MVLKWRDLLMSWAVRGNWNTSTYYSELEVWLGPVSGNEFSYMIDKNTVRIS